MKVEIIAEIGINHSGNLVKAMEMVNLVAQSGADTAKFQMVNPDLVYKTSDPLWKIFHSARFSIESWARLKHHTEARGLEFLCTPGEKESADNLDKLGVKRFKVASDSAKDVKFVNYVLSKGKPTIVSMGQLTNFMDIVHLVDKYSRQPDYIFHCVSKYPTAPTEANMDLLKELIRGGFTMGYSDHVQGYEACLLAVAYGATVVEKHFMLTAQDIDAPVSLFHGKFNRMVHEIRALEQLI